MGRKRLRKHKQRTMNKRLGKGPMCEETKAARKRTSTIDRARTKAALDKALANSAKKATLAK